MTIGNIFSEPYTLNEKKTNFMVVLNYSIIAIDFGVA